MRINIVLANCNIAVVSISFLSTYVSAVVMFQFISVDTFYERICTL